MENNSLYHHGVPGMKWGVRRYQNRDGTRINKNDTKNYSKNKTEGLGSDAQFLLTMAAVNAVLAVPAILSPSIKNIIDIKKNKVYYNKKYESRQIKTLSEAPKIKKKQPISKVLKNFNPGFKNDELGSTMNCTFCTAALVLRKKGYDVVPVKSKEGMFEKNRIDWFKNSKYEKVRVKDASQLFDILNSKGNNSYGELVINFKMGGSHSIFWENSNGKTKIIDGQTGKIYDKSSWIDGSFSNYIDYKSTNIRQLDNVEPTDRILGAVKVNPNH